MDLLGRAVASVIPACITYPFTVSDNLSALDHAAGQLMAVEADVKYRVELAELRGFRQIDKVQRWLYWAKTLQEDADEIRRRYEERSSNISGRSSNGSSSYRISKDAARKVKEMQLLSGIGGKLEEVVFRPPSSKKFRVASPVLPKEEADLHKILRYIENDHDDIIGIWGAGGAGKTRLLHLVYNWYAQSTAFGDVIFITASRECSTEQIRTEIELKHSIRCDRRDSIEPEYCFRHGSFLLLLDDLWDQIDFRSVGIRFPLGRFEQFNRKVVITTRKLSVCGLMDVKKSHMVAGLDGKDALHLFHEKVGVETINSNPLILPLTRQVVDELDRLPLALITIGKAMYGEKDPSEWVNVIEVLRSSRLNKIERTCDEEKIYSQLKLSYDRLKTQELRDCFLACSLWPEDWLIPKIELIECWMGLGILDSSNARNIYKHSNTLVEKLISAYLLEEAGPKHVKLHDVIRDMAVWLASGFGKNRDKWVIRTGVGVHEVLHEKNDWCKIERATLLRHYCGNYCMCWSLSGSSRHGESTSIPCQAKNLHFLNIQHNNNIENNKYFYGSLIGNFESFHALTFLNMSHCNMHNFPPSISNLVNLRYLNLSHNSINYVPGELKLRNLKYFLLRKNSFVRFGEGTIPELRELRVLDLSGTDFVPWRPACLIRLIKELLCLDHVRHVGITLQRTVQFQSLELPKLPIRSLLLNWSENAEILLIPGSFIGSSEVQDNLNKLSLTSRECPVKKVVIESDPQNPYSHLRNLERLKISEMIMLEEIICRNVTPKDLFLKLQRLKISSCPRLKDVSWALYLPCLTQLSLYRCGDMVQLIEQSSLTSATEEGEHIVSPTFPSLTDLYLSSLPNLQIISDESIMFPSLKNIDIWGCPMLKKLPFKSSSVPSQLTTIAGEGRWWTQLEWQDSELKTALERLFFYKISSYVRI